MFGFKYREDLQTGQMSEAEAMLVLGEEMLRDRRPEERGDSPPSSPRRFVGVAPMRCAARDMLESIGVVVEGEGWKTGVWWRVGYESWGPGTL